jgi:hypothetical protein
MSYQPTQSIGFHQILSHRQSAHVIGGDVSPNPFVPSAPTAPVTKPQPAPAPQNPPRRIPAFIIGPGGVLIPLPPEDLPLDPGPIIIT